MNSVLARVLNNAIAAGWIVLILLLLRLLLRKNGPVRAGLWAIAALRLMMPISIESACSPAVRIEWDAQPLPDAGEQILMQTGDSAVRLAEPRAALKTAVWIVWLTGVCIMLAYALVRTILLRRRVRASLLKRANVYICDDIRDAFILGWVRPKIYLPSGMDEETRKFVTAHEQTHLDRRDHITKPVAYLLLCVYWFHPLLWLGYILFCRDLEFACDERTVQSYDAAHRAAYCDALLKSSPTRFAFDAHALPFGATPVKARVLAVLRTQRPSRFCCAVSALIGIFVGLCSLTVPKAAVPAPFPDLTSAEQLYGKWTLDRMEYRDYEGDRVHLVQHEKLDDRMHITFLPDGIAEVHIRPGTQESVVTYEIDSNRVMLYGKTRTDSRNMPLFVQIQYDPQTDSLSVDVRSLVSETYTRAQESNPTADARTTAFVDQPIR